MTGVFDAAAFEVLARRRLRAEPPGFAEDRADLKGDHSLDPDGLATTGETPRAAAVLVPVVMHPDRPSILLTERAHNLRQHAGQIAFPGGRVDPEDASPLHTALREAQEEIGLDPDAVRPLGYLDAYLSGTNYIVVPVIGIVRPGFTLTLNRHEVDHAFEVPLAFLMDEVNHELHSREFRGRLRRYYAIPYGTHYIWGVTAGILRNMYEKLYRL